MTPYDPAEVRRYLDRQRAQQARFIPGLRPRYRNVAPFFHGVRSARERGPR
ncbi:hypothetical protein M8Z33_07380 [Streptomyces sp. ZAF1911]|uniref:hypothetical protein n=1 Tax=Streptomyces sp. ZAF1911 TaxID=2944129 RepID=UPI00237C132E|nr:hypothetical protein [Streptomyces sp. ZAF1911]MDD9376495.1 hypothetical protein [Streptomyces sp. ZAF1911]